MTVIHESTEYSAKLGHFFELGLLLGLGRSRPILAEYLIQKYSLKPWDNNTVLKLYI